MKRAVKSLARRAGYEIASLGHRSDRVANCRPAEVPDEVDHVLPYTMTEPERVVALLDAVDYLIRSGIEGDIVECGVWRGGSMMAAALRLAKHGDLRRLWLFDTFEGMTAPDPAVDGEEAVERFGLAKPYGVGSDWCLADLDDVTANMASTGYPDELMWFAKGRVEETLQGEVPDRIALLRLDTDFYHSTVAELDRLAPLVVDGGVLILDDYGRWEGQRRAVDQWLERWPHPVFLQRVDRNCRMAVLSRAC